MASHHGLVTPSDANEVIPMTVRLRLLLAAFSLCVLDGSTISVADEGMWTFDNPPLQQLKDRYGFTPTQQ